jgi:hypothetical protein
MFYTWCNTIVFTQCATLVRAFDSKFVATKKQRIKDENLKFSYIAKKHFYMLAYKKSPHQRQLRIHWNNSLGVLISFSVNSSLQIVDNVSRSSTRDLLYILRF